MFTYIVYLAIPFLSSLFAYVALISREKSGYGNLYTVSLFLSFLVLFVPAAIRFDIGADYSSYNEYFDIIKNGGIVHKEPLYILFNKFLAILGFDFQSFIVITSFLIYYLIYKSVPLEILPVFILFYVLLIYLGTYCIIRQEIAVSLMLYAFVRYSNKPKKYILFAILSLFIHFGTGLMMLIIYPISKTRINKFIAILFIVAIAIIILKTNFVFNLFSFVVSFFPQYEWYLNSQFIAESSVGSGVGIIFRLLLAIVLILLKDNVEKLYPHINYNSIMNYYLLYLLFYLLSIKLYTFGRILDIFIIFYVLVLSYTYAALNKYLKVLFLISIAGIYTIFYVNYIKKQTYEYNIQNNKGIAINPYQTIFEK